MIRSLLLAIRTFTTLIPALSAVVTIRFLVLLTVLFLLHLSGRHSRALAVVAYLFDWVILVHIADVALLPIFSLLLLLLMMRSRRLLRVKSFSY